MLGVTAATLRSWESTGKVRTVRAPSGVRFLISETFTHISRKAKTVVCYARVSSRAQQGDPQRQKDFLLERYPDAELVVDVCSGISWERRGLNALLERAYRQDIGEIVLAHRDRLSRAAYPLLERIFNLCGVKLTVLDHDNERGTSPEQDLVEEVLTILHVYSCREMPGKKIPKEES